MPGYSVKFDTENIFGSQNIRRWADLDNANDSTIIDARIETAIDEAKEFIDGKLAGCRYVIPFTAIPYDPIIVRLSARYAGVVLYDSRKLIDNLDFDEVMNHRMTVLRQLRQIHIGLLTLITLDNDVIDYMKAVEDDPVILDQRFAGGFGFG